MTRIVREGATNVFDAISIVQLKTLQLEHNENVQCWLLKNVLPSCPDRISQVGNTVKCLFNGDSMVALSGDCKVNPCGMQNGQYRLVAESEIMAAKCLLESVFFLLQNIPIILPAAVHIQKFNLK